MGICDSSKIKTKTKIGKNKRVKLEEILFNFNIIHEIQKQDQLWRINETHELPLRLINPIDERR